jgi:predicted TPR repeat methyltransferase
MGEWRVLDLGCGSGLCGKVFQDFFVSTSKIDDRNSKINIDVKDKKDLNNIIEESTINDNEDNDVIKIDDYGLDILKKARCQPGGFMMGIDISIKMVEITEKSGFYTSVARGDLLESLKIFEHFENTHNTHNSTSLSHNNISQKSTKIDQNNDNNGITDNHDSSNLNKDLKLDLILVADTFIYVGGLSNVFKQVYMYIYIYAYIYAYIYTCVCIYTYIYCAYIHIYICIYMYMYIYTYK